jgi:hypothetical protein
VEREGIFKSTIGNESLHEISNANVVGIVNFVTQKYLILRVEFSHITPFINTHGLIPMEECVVRLISS